MQRLAAGQGRDIVTVSCSGDSTERQLRSQFVWHTDTRSECCVEHHDGLTRDGIAAIDKFKARADRFAQCQRAAGEFIGIERLLIFRGSSDGGQIAGAEQIAANCDNRLGDITILSAIVDPIFEAIEAAIAVVRLVGKGPVVATRENGPVGRGSDNRNGPGPTIKVDVIGQQMCG